MSLEVLAEELRLLNKRGSSAAIASGKGAKARYIVNRPPGPGRQKPGRRQGIRRSLERRRVTF